MTPQETKSAITRARDAVAYAVRSGERPDPSDLLVLQFMTPPRTICERLQASVFPLAVVIIAMCIMMLLATNRPPIVGVTGEAHTTALNLTLQGDQFDSRALSLASPSAVPFHASGFARALIGTCKLDLTEEGMLFTGTGIRLPLAAATRLHLEVDRLEGSFGSGDPRLSLFVTSETNSIIDAFGVTINKPQLLDPTCLEESEAELDPGEGDSSLIELSVSRVLAADFPDFIAPLLKLPVSAVTFGHWRNADHTEFCALKSAQMRVRQEIKILGISVEENVTPSVGTCFEITGGDITFLPFSDGTFGVRFNSVASNLDDGLPANASGSTYLQVLTTDPQIGLILGAITFILTTVWSLAILIKEILI